MPTYQAPVTYVPAPVVIQPQVVYTTPVCQPAPYYAPYYVAPRPMFQWRGDYRDRDAHGRFDQRGHDGRGGGNGRGR